MKSESPLDRELRSTIQGAAQDHLAGWEFTPAMRQSVLDRIAAEEAGGVTTQMRPTGGRAAGRRIGWRPMYAAAAAAAAVVMFFVMTRGGLFHSMQKAADSGRELASAPQAAQPMEAPAPAPAPAEADAAQRSAAPPSGAQEEGTGTAAAPSGEAPSGKTAAGSRPDGTSDTAVAAAQAPVTGEAAAGTMGITATDQATVRPPHPTLMIMAGGQSGEGAYLAADTVQLDVTLEAGSEQAWGGPIALEAWVTAPGGVRTELPAQDWETDLPAGGGALMTAVTWDQTLAGGARAPAGEYTLYVRARAAGGQSSEGHVIIRLSP